MTEAPQRTTCCNKRCNGQDVTRLTLPHMVAVVGSKAVPVTVTIIQCAHCKALLGGQLTPERRAEPPLIQVAR